MFANPCTTILTPLSTVLSPVWKRCAAFNECLYHRIGVIRLRQLTCAIWGAVLTLNAQKIMVYAGLNFDPGATILIISGIFLGFFVAKTFFSPHQSQTTQPVRRFAYTETDKEMVVKIIQDLFKTEMGQALSDFYKASNEFFHETNSLEGLQEEFLTDLKMGTCKGQAVALIEIACRHPDSSSKDLLAKASKQQVYYHSIFHFLVGEIECHAWSKRVLGMTALSHVFGEKSKSYLKAAQVLKDNLIKWKADEFLSDNIFLQHNFENISLLQWERFNCSIIKQNDFGKKVIDSLNELKQKSSFEDTFVGYIGIMPPDGEGHAIFFQAGPHYFRFYDPNGFVQNRNNKFVGFHEFSGEDELFANLYSCVSQYDEGKVEMFLYDFAPRSF